MSPEDEIAGCEEELRVAMLSGDVAALDGLLSDALIFTDQAGRRLAKVDDLAAHRSGLLKIDRLDFSARAIRLMGDMAVVAVRADLAGRYDGSSFAGCFAYTRMWRRGAQQWHIEAAHCSAVA